MGEFVMHRLFPIVCNMSLTASVVILAVLAVRLLLRRAPKVFSYALWAVVLFRLLCPVSVTSAVSLLGALGAPAQERTAVTSVVEYVPTDIVRNMAPTVTPLPQEPFPAEPGENIVSTAPSVTQPAAAPASPLSGPVAVLTLTWLTGMALLLLYSVISLLRLRRRLVGAVRLEDNIYLADYIPSPFVMGLFRPKIYLPSTLTETERGYILRHEQYHLRRRDHVVKLLSFLALCVHWFNPLVWAAFILAGKDMEMSCDEAVVRELGEDIRADYSASLLSLATGRRIVAGMPLAFGEGDTGGRIRNLLNWKRPQPWIIAVCAVVCVGLIALCAANPKGSGIPTEDPPADRTETGQWPSVEAYVQQVMLSQTEARYYTENADGTASGQPHTAAVTDRKLEYLTKGGELAGLDPDGVLEEWEYFYLVKLDVDTASVALVGGQYYDDEEYFSLDDRHVIVALRHDDGSYDILCDDPINDGGDFFGYHNTMEEAIYDWYVTDQNLDLPLYVEDWIDQINYNTEEGKPGNYPVHRYDVDGGYLYIPTSAWIMADVTAHRSHGHWEWYSGYDTGSILTVDRFTQTLEDEYITSRKQGFEPLDDTKQIWKRRQDGINERYYFYPRWERLLAGLDFVDGSGHQRLSLHLHRASGDVPHGGELHADGEPSRRRRVHPDYDDLHLPGGGGRACRGSYGLLHGGAEKRRAAALFSGQRPGQKRSRLGAGTSGSHGGAASVAVRFGPISVPRSSILRGRPGQWLGNLSGRGGDLADRAVQSPAHPDARGAGRLQRRYGPCGPG